jgi:hypothetical protein
MSAYQLNSQPPEADQEILYLESIEARMEEIYFDFCNLVTLDGVDEVRAREQAIEMLRQTARRLFPEEESR